MPRISRHSRTSGPGWARPRTSHCVLDIGSGFNTPTVVRWPMERVAARHPNARLVRINLSILRCPGDRRGALAIAAGCSRETVHWRCVKRLQRQLTEADPMTRLRIRQDRSPPHDPMCSISVSQPRSGPTACRRDYTQHNPVVADGKRRVHRVFRTDDLGLLQASGWSSSASWRRRLPWSSTAFSTGHTTATEAGASTSFDSMTKAKIVEHWDVLQRIPCRGRQRANTMF